MKAFEKEKNAVEATQLGEPEIKKLSVSLLQSYENSLVEKCFPLQVSQKPLVSKRVRGGGNKSP